jgi:predicted DNA-binding transcriptional regulator AlpA
MRKTPMNKPHLDFSPLLTANDVARRFKISLSWLAKARMRGDGPPYIRIGRSIRYTEAATIQWMKSRQRLSTSEQ